MKKYILAEKYKGSFRPIEVEDSLNALFENLEYGDVAEGEYQIWEYPEGKVFMLEPDRGVTDRDYYAPPDRALWQPKLTPLTDDAPKVLDAYEHLLNSRKNKSLLGRIVRKLGRK